MAHLHACCSCLALGRRSEYLSLPRNFSFYYWLATLEVVTGVFTGLVEKNLELINDCVKIFHIIKQKLPKVIMKWEGKWEEEGKWVELKKEEEDGGEQSKYYKKVEN